MVQSVLAGLMLGATVGTLSFTAYATGMWRTGLEGALELFAFFLAVLTAPASALGALAGRLTFGFGHETAFIVTSLTWAVLCVPYAVTLRYIWLRLSTKNPEPVNP